MHVRTHLAAVLFAFTPLAALSQQIDDPANLMGERVSPPAVADTLPIDHGAPALEQLLRKLRTRASMMLIVAHPDDEDGGLLTLESRGMGARVATLTLTRGEGGQNLMTGDFNDALGLIRTQELLAEDRYTGVDQFFGTEVDFGFSKTKEESFKQWTHERVLYDAVRAVRLYRPLVLASVFIGGVTDGHGQHQVSGEITQEVFLAAADPKVFPEMGLPPWAPLRVYARVPFARITEKGMFDYATGKFLPPHFHNYLTGVDTTTPPPATVTIHEGDVPNIPGFHGMSYVQWARQGLALQKTQIGANFRIPPAGRVDVGYTLYGSRMHCKAAQRGTPCFASEIGDGSTSTVPADQGPDEDLFTGMDVGFPGIANLAKDAPIRVRVPLVMIDQELKTAQRVYDPAHIDRTVPFLRDALEDVDDLIKNLEARKFDAQEKFDILHELRVKRVQLNDALVLALGLTLRAEMTAGGAYRSTSKSFDIKLDLANSGSFPVRDPSFSIALAPQTITVASTITDVRTLEHRDTITIREHLDLTNDLSPTRPYFSRPNEEQPYYDVASPGLRNAPSTPSPLVASATVLSDGLPLTIRSVVIDPGFKEVVITPPVSLLLEPRVAIFPKSEEQVAFKVFRYAGGSYGGESFGRAYSTFPRSLPMPATLWDVDFKLPLALAVANELFYSSDYPSSIEVVLSRTSNELSEPGTVQATDRFEGKDYGEGYRSVGYPGLSHTNYYTPATLKVVPVDVTTASSLNIAFLPGTGDEVPDSLPSLGVRPRILTPKDLTADTLKQYDAVILGVRAYSAHPELEGAGSAALNEYAKQGGVVIVQYSSGGFDPASAPYPYTVPGDSAHNVVDEDQPVKLLAPDNPLLTWPNKITSADFDHWIEERGHGFASDWSPEYTPLLETHDPDQDPQKGGLLVAKVGNGAYIYCAFALYRQLPEGVPGAYRLLANLLSYAKNPGR